MKIMRRRTMFLVAAVSFSLAIGLYMAIVRPPVLITPGPGPLFHDPRFTVLNPIRSRGPERAAESFLDLLRTGRIETAMSQLEGTDPKNMAVIQEEERSYPLTGWRLVDRHDRAGECTMTYAYTFEGFVGELRLRLDIVTKKESDAWQVIEYHRIY